MSARRRRVVLVRQWDSQHTGSGCCGGFGGTDGELGCDAEFADARALMERMGAVYRALRAELGDAVDVEVVDPRNTAWLVPALWRDARRAGGSRADAWRTVRRGSADGAVVADGRVLSTGEPPSPDAVVDAVLEVLATRAV